MTDELVPLTASGGMCMPLSEALLYDHRPSLRKAFLDAMRPAEDLTTAELEARLEARAKEALRRAAESAAQREIHGTLTRLIAHLRRLGGERVVIADLIEHHLPNIEHAHLMGYVSCPGCDGGDDHGGGFPCSSLKIVCNGYDILIPAILCDD